MQVLLNAINTVATIKMFNDIGQPRFEFCLDNGVQQYVSPLLVVALGLLLLPSLQVSLLCFLNVQGTH